VRIGDQQTMVPGPDDSVRVIILLRGEPVAAYKTSLLQAEGRLTAASAAALQAYADRLKQEQQVFREQLESQGIAFEATQTFQYLVNGLAGRMKEGDRQRIAGLPQVKGVYPDYQVQAMLDESVPLIGAPEVWAMTDAHGLPVTGKGIRVAVIDTGIDYTHPDLGGCFGAGCKVAAGYDFVNKDADPMDDNGHGTHCAGIVAANGTIRGVAPDATLYAYKALNSGGSGRSSDIIAAVEHAADPDSDPSSDDSVDVISMSLGGSGTPDDPMALAVDAAVDAGVTVVVAAGNDGPGYQTVSSPGVARKALTVGATNKSDQMADFSSRGPITEYYNLIKPNVVAPGVSINSTFRGGYEALSGTSMATPHITGAAALIKQLHPTWPPATIQANLMNTARNLGLDIFTQGAGRVQVDRAAHAGAVLAPGNIGFGLVDTEQPLWTKTEILRLTNTTTTSASYSLQVSGTLPTGVTTRLEPAGIALDAGDSVTVTFQITVDNALAPYQSLASGFYEGQVVVNPSLSAMVGAAAIEPLVVPFALIKSPRLDLTFDENPGIVLVHDRTRVVAFRENPDAHLSLLLPAGTYDIWVSYGVDTWVVREGVIVSEVTRLDIRRSDATHTISLAPRDKDGKAIRPEDRFFVYQLRHMVSGVAVTLSPCCTPFSQMHFSDISDSNVWAWRMDLAWEGAWYEFNDRLSGIVASSTYQNAPAAFRHVAYQWHPGPTQAGLVARSYASSKPFG